MSSPSTGGGRAVGSSTVIMSNSAHDNDKNNFEEEVLISPAVTKPSRNEKKREKNAINTSNTSHVKIDLGDCRFYEQSFPEQDELVMVKVNRIADMGAYVSLLEYNNMEGMILMSELSKRRFRSVNKLIRVGRHEVVIVMRVDPLKGYIDLSKRRVSPEDIVKCEERFSKSKKVHQTVRHVAQMHKMKVDELNRRVIWPLYERFGHALDALKEAALCPEKVFDGLEVDEAVRQSLIQDIQLRLSPQALKLRVRVDVWCFGKDGIDAVRDALDKGRSIGDSSVGIHIRMIAPPQYVVVTSCYDKELGMSRIKQAVKTISECVKRYKGGEFKQEGDIIVMGGEEEKRLGELLEEFDDDEEDSDEDKDEGMGKVDGDIPEDRIEDDDKSDDEL